jgi:DNA-binding protein HU-beta
MNRKEMAQDLAARTELSENKAYGVIGEIMDIISGRLKKGDSVTLVGFGTWSVAKRAARKGRNPSTGESIKIKAKKVTRFKAGTSLKNTVNGG